MLELIQPASNRQKREKDLNNMMTMGIIWFSSVLTEAKKKLLCCGLLWHCCQRCVWRSVLEAQTMTHIRLEQVVLQQYRRSSDFLQTDN